jgi:hypothetical protein
MGSDQEADAADAGPEAEEAAAAGGLGKVNGPF